MAFLPAKSRAALRLAVRSYHSLYVEVSLGKKPIPKFLLLVKLAPCRESYCHQWMGE